MAALTDWITSFWNILIKPTPKTFRQEAEKARGKTFVAFLLIIFMFLLLYLLMYLISNELNLPGILPSFVVISIFLAAIYYFYALIKNFIYKQLFKRKRDFVNEFFYLDVIVLYLTTFFNTIFFLIPGLSPLFALITWLYFFILNVTSLKAITNLKVWQALMTMILGAFIAVLGIILVPVFILSVNDSVVDMMGSGQSILDWSRILGP